VLLKLDDAVVVGLDFFCIVTSVGFWPSRFIWWWTI